jgi:hypothetical protein
VILMCSSLPCVCLYVLWVARLVCTRVSWEEWNDPKFVCPYFVQEEGSFCLATHRGLPCAVSAVAASCSLSFLSYLTPAQV